MGEKTIIRARDTFRKKFYHKGYNGKRHVLIGFSLFTVFSLLPWFFLESISSKSFFLFALFFIISTFVLYYQHRFPQHRLMKGFKFFFKIHRVHHSFFDYEHMYVKDSNDNLFILFPISFIVSYCLILFPLFSAPFYFLMGWDAFLLATSSACFYFFCHEVIHYLGHTQKDHPLYKIGFVEFLREHHRIHHDRSENPVVNFNMILPLGDYFFKTFKSKSKVQDQSINHGQA